MNDIDFDELDRAVSSLIGKPKAGDTPSNVSGSAQPVQSPTRLTPTAPLTTPASSRTPEPKMTTPSVPAQASAPHPPSESPTKTWEAATHAARPAASSPISPLRTAPKAATPTTTIPAARRAGRFMDVVRPQSSSSSSVSTTNPSLSRLSPPKTASPVPTPTRVSYTGKPLQPLSHMPTPPAPEKAKKEMDDDEPLLPATAASHSEVHAVDYSEGAKDLSPPLFLSGTKVEKRPLGAFSGNKDKEPESPHKKEGLKPLTMHDGPEVIEKPGASLLDELPPAVSGADMLPPELDQRVVAVEAGDIASSDEDDRPDTPPAYPPEPGIVKPETSPRPAIHQLATAASQSIPAQYKAKHTETDMTPHPIFDTKQYHQPLSHASNKHTSRKPLVWALIVLSLLAVGAGLGVGAYFLLG